MKDLNKGALRGGADQDVMLKFKFKNQIHKYFKILEKI